MTWNGQTTTKFITFYVKMISTNNLLLSIDGDFTPILFGSMALSEAWLNYMFSFAWAYQCAQHRWAHNMIWTYASGKLIFHTISNMLWNVIDFQRAIFISVCDKQKKKKKNKTTTISRIIQWREKTTFIGYVDKSDRKIRRFAIIFRLNLFMHLIQFKFQWMHKKIADCPIDHFDWKIFTFSSSTDHSYRLRDSSISTTSISWTIETINVEFLLEYYSGWMVQGIDQIKMQIMFC